MTRWLPRVWPLVLAVTVLAPLAAPGYVLAYDMVFVPDLDLRADYFGLRETLPRAVPSDAVVAMLSLALPGQVIQKAALLAALAGAAAGVIRLLRGAPLVVRLVGATAFVWNPYVAERLLIGQWVVLVSHAALPWVVGGALQVRRGAPRGLAATLVAVAVAAMSPSGGLVALVTALVVAWWPAGERAEVASARRDRVLLGIGAVAVNAPWMAAGLLSAGQAVTEAAGVEAFAARAEGHLPVWATVASLGGIWNSETVPDSRLTWVPAVWLVVLVVAAVLGWPGLGRHAGTRVRAALAFLGALSLLVSLAGTVSPGVLAAAMDVVPGLALLRDGTRYLGPLVLLQALLLGFAAGSLVARAKARGAPRPLPVTVGALCMLAPLAVLPDLAWGAGGRLTPTSYPDSWSAARAAVERDGRSGDAMVLPLAPYRAYAWNDATPGLDPAGRFFPVVTRMSEALEVDDKPVQQEDPGAARAARLFFEGDAADLADEGVGFVVVDAEVPPLAARADRLGLERVYEAADLKVFGVPDAQDSTTTAVRAVLVSVAWGGCVLTLGGCAVGLVRRRDRRHYPGVRPTS